MCKVICVCNFKGGCGKSTSAANLGYGLAREGKKVLMVDTDSQRGLSICMGYHNTNELDVTLHSVFRKMIDKGEVIAEEGILHHEEGPDLMPASSLISVLEPELLQMKNGEYLLGRYLEEVKKHYDYCIVDCNSNLGRMTISALIASDSVLIPVKAENLSIEGLQELISTIGIIRRQQNPKLSFEGILINMFHCRRKKERLVDEIVRNAYGKHIRIFQQNIPDAAEVSDATDDGISIYSYSKKCKAAQAYDSFIREVLANE